jgi:nicotinamidase-related amidase
MLNSYAQRPGDVILKISPKETCLLVIDMQEGFVSSNGSFGKFDPEYPKPLQKLLPIIRHAIEYCRGIGIPVVYTKQTHVPQFFSTAPTYLGREIAAIRGAGFRVCMKGTKDADILEELKTTEKDHVIEKNKASAFYMTWLDLWLRYFHTRTLLITGCETGYCVLHTVQDAVARDLNVIVVEDGVGDPLSYIQDAVLQLIDMRFGRVLSWKNIECALDRFPEEFRISGAKP